MSPKATRSLRLGAAFLMATSAIGPGFLTQTCLFTVQLKASFGFVILLSVLLDLAAQLNIWQIITGSGMSATTLANRLRPGLGHVLTALVFSGGLAFNIGNVAGAGMGLEVSTGLPAPLGAALSTLLAAGLLLGKNAGKAMDVFARVLGLLMILLTAWVAFSAHPPMGEVLKYSFFPATTNWNAVLTLVGGTVGGYICFAGAHRLLEAGVSGPEQRPAVVESALTGIGIATAMRILLFLAALGVVYSGAPIDAANPPASVFQQAAGDWGYRFFGLVMWSAAITSVVGATFTSFTFLLASVPAWEKYKNAAMLAFLMVSLGVFITVGKPVQLLVWAGALNGIVLPLALALMLLAAEKAGLAAQLRLPLWLRSAGWLVVGLLSWMAAKALVALL